MVCFLLILKWVWTVFWTSLLKTLKMIINPSYTIQPGDVHLLFNSFMFKKYCERKGIELHQLLQKVQKSTEQEPSEELKDVKPFTTDDIPDILYAGHETYCRYNKIPFQVDETDVYTWIDAMGGPVSGTAKFAEVITYFFGKLLNIDVEMLNASVVEEEKKSMNGAVLQNA